MESSFCAQVADLHHFDLGIRVTTPSVQFRPSTARPFNGTIAQCVSIVRRTVHHILDNTDYDGIKPYLRLIDQMKTGKPIGTWTIDARHEESASTCVGMSLTLLETMHQQLGVEGALAIQRNPDGRFGHAAVLITCADGLVFVDNQSEPELRIFSVAFNSIYRGNGFSMIAASRDDTPPLVIDRTGERHEFYTDIANGTDLVMKDYMSRSIQAIIPIAVCRKDGTTLKDIIVKPLESRIRLMDYNTQKKAYITFESIRQKGLGTQLAQFMGADFHISPRLATREVEQFVDEEHRIQKLFHQTHS
jgi:hypothetical protein